MAGHAFVSYIREDAAVVDLLVAALRAKDLSIWLDRDSIGAGQRWKATIHQAIRGGYLFVACFSRNYFARGKSYMNEELTVAIEELRQRPRQRAWFIPVSLDGSDIPYIEIGAGETLHDLQRVDFSRDAGKAADLIVRAANLSREDAKSPERQESPPSSRAAAPGKSAALAAKLFQIDKRHVTASEWDAFIWSGESIPVAHAELERLFATMQTLGGELRAQVQALKPEVEVEGPTCLMRLGRHTIVLSWLPHASNFVARSQLYVLDYDRPHYLSRPNLGVPEPPVVAKYEFSSNDGQYGWQSGSTFRTSREVAEWCAESLISHLEHSR